MLRVIHIASMGVAAAENIALKTAFERSGFT
jgi:hypothetical protein